MIRRVVSGGQTGVDRAALDAAMAAGIACGGWCPRGRRAEDGVIPPRYPLRETPRSEYAQRTAWNVRDSDGTLVLHQGPLSGGSALTVRLAREQGRAVLVVALGETPAYDAVLAWLTSEHIRVLNVAGPRESSRPGIGAMAREWLDGLLSHAREAADG